MMRVVPWDEHISRAFVSVSSAVTAAGLAEWSREQSRRRAAGSDSGRKPFISALSPAAPGPRDLRGARRAAGWGSRAGRGCSREVVLLSPRALPGPHELATCGEAGPASQGSLSCREEWVPAELAPTPQAHLCLTFTLLCRAPLVSWVGHSPTGGVSRTWHDAH